MAELETLTRMETPTEINLVEEAIYRFALWSALRLRGDASGNVEIPCDSMGDDSEALTQWTDEFIEANQPLDAEQREVLRFMAQDLANQDLSETEIDGLLSLVDAGLGIRDIVVINRNAPVSTVAVTRRIYE